MPKKDESCGIVQKLTTSTLVEYAEQATKIYGSEVVHNRSIPDYRDGLKPVQRAILWSMYKLGLHHKGAYKKAARVIGDCIGQYHPRGDCLRGDTLVPLLSGKDVTIKELCVSGAGDQLVLAMSKYDQLVPTVAHSWREGQSSNIMYKITVDGEAKTVIELTENHQLYVLRGHKQGWIKAKHLRVNDFLAGGFFNIKPCFDYSVFVDDTKFKKFRLALSTHGQVVQCVEVVVLEEHEVFYDFTVDGHENMVVLTSGGIQTGNFVVAHNSPAYQAMVGMVNMPTALIDGYGNWGSHIEKAAAQRYSMRGDTKVSTEFGLIAIDEIPKFLNIVVDSDVIDIDIKVPSLNGEFARASKWMYNGERKCYKIITKSGIEISSTMDHKYYVYDGTTCTHCFARLEDLEIGDFLCASRDTLVEGAVQKFDHTYSGELYEVYNSNYFYDPIVSIEFDGIHSVYDLTVDYTNAFVANGLMVHNCVVSGTKIMTEYGLVNIESIPLLANGITDQPSTLTSVDLDMAVMSSGESARASKWLYSGKHKTYKVTTRLGFSIQCTINEPFLVINKNLKYEWRALETLCIGDTVCLTGATKEITSDELVLPADTITLLASMTKALVKDAKPVLYSDYLKGRFYSFKSALTRYVGETECTMQDFCYDGETRRNLVIACEQSILEPFGILDWSEYTSYVPKMIFNSNVESVRLYIRGIFSMYTNISGPEYALSSRSCGLLTDVKLLLCCYFGVVTDKIVESENGFLQLRILSVDTCIEHNLIHQHSVDKYRAALCKEKSALSSRLSYDIIPHASHYIEQGHIKAIALNTYTEDDLQKMRSLTKHSTLLKSQLNFPSMPQSPLIDRLNIVLKNGYTYDSITDIVECGIHDVFDLTVDDTHAFVANAFVIHNTEARLSEYSGNNLLDPEYLAVVEMMPNYSEDLMMPVVLPAKLPNLLINGNTSIAVGVAASSPPFALKGVLNLTRRCLHDTILTSELCYKYLEFNYRYGGTSVSDKADLLALYKTGRGTIQFEPTYNSSLVKREFRITSTCPGLNSQASIEKLLSNISNVPGVKLVSDGEDKDGICYLVQFGKVGDVKINEAIAAIKKLIIKRERYDFGAIERIPTGTQFLRLSPIELIEKWCKWRIDIELKVLTNRIQKTEALIKNTNLMVLAIDNIAIMADSLTKTNSEQYLVQQLKVTEAEASTLMNVRFKQLKRMEKRNLKEYIASEKAHLKKHVIALNKPNESIIEGLKTLI
jgi:intein/homing endonuclease